MEKQEDKTGSGLGCLFRLFWMFGGPVALFFCLVFTIEKQTQFPSIPDGIYILAVATLILARYVDIRFFAGTTAEGKPTTMNDWRRFAGLVAVVSLAAWILTRLIAVL